MVNRKILLSKVKVHNLKSIDLELNTNELIVFTGVSGSGKSSLAFDTLYVEGQRRYVESLSTFARRQLGEMAKPDMEHASGITPTVSIEQKSTGRNPRSTVGTITEIYDYLRVLYARVGEAHCPISGERVTPQSRERIIRMVQSMPTGTKIIVLSPYAKGKKGEFKDDFQDLLRKGYMRLRVDGKWVEIGEGLQLDRNLAHDIDVVIDRIKVDPDSQSRIAEAITNALNFGNGLCSVYDQDRDDEKLYSMHAYSPKSGISYTSLEPQDFSFNSPSGMCPRCNGMGEVMEFDLEKIIDPEKSIADDFCSVGSSYQTVRYGNIYNNLAEMFGFSVKTPWKNLSKDAKDVMLYGTKKKWTRMRFVHPDTGAVWWDLVRWQGILHEARRRYQEAKSERYRKNMELLMHQQVCPECHGERLKPYPAATLFQGKRIAEVSNLTVSEALSFFENVSLPPDEALIAEELLKEIRERLKFLMEVGLHYLSLNRTSPTLSGGEAQRVRLASQIGSGLVGITYILDEPSIGLHHRDNKKLIRTLEHLRDMGNTVIVVEHDEDTIWTADTIVDFGPGPGERGGEIVVNGDLKALLNSKKSLTGGYLTGRLEIPFPKIRRKPKEGFLEIRGATHHNLKNVKVKIPLGIFVAITGVSGSGKSSLITDILYPALSNALQRSELKVGPHKEILGTENIDKVIAIDQSPIGRNPRSNPGTYIKVFDDIRELFSQLPDSKAKGFKPGRFSFNVREGSCPECNGIGMIKVDMDFMEDAWVDCPVCHNKRFDDETLSVYYKGKNIHDILEMEVGQALHLFENIPNIRHKLETLCNVGLDYLKLGQSSTTLSGGEAQRVKLARELVRPATGRTLYIFDEPTTGLHFHDIKHLLEVLQELVERGNSVLIIEHNMDIVKTADWIIDLGPEGGYGGGEIVGEGSPEKIAKLKTPTAEAVHEALYQDRMARAKAALETAKERKNHRKEREETAINKITVRGAEQNNLKHLDVDMPREKMTILTGPSGSGKTSLAFDTVYAEGQRRYIESLSAYARQFVKQMSKPKVQRVDGLSPAIAIEQKAHAGNPRSTIGTMTEIYDYLRVLYARIGIPHDPLTGEVIKSITKEDVLDRILTWSEGEKIQILAPIEIKKHDRFEDLVARLRRQGFVRIRLNGQYYELDQDELLTAFDRKRKNELFLVIDRLIIKPEIRDRLLEAISSAARLGGNKFTVAREDKDVFFNLAFAVESTGKSFPAITPQSFAFNIAEGMCPDCQGLGYQYGANLARFPEIMHWSIKSLLRTIWQDKSTHAAIHLLEEFLREEGINPLTPLHDLPPHHVQLIMNGSPPDKWTNSHLGFSFRWIGINATMAKIGKSAQSELREEVIPLLDEIECFTCQGTRLNPLGRNVTIKGLSISDLCRLPIEQSLAFIDKITLKAGEQKLLDEVKRQLIHRLQFLCQVGLEYLSLDRKAPSLSGGETQRIRLARQLGTGLTGVLYVLDEPTIGLHPRDNDRLNEALHQLKKLGNTMLLVEHDPMTIKTADYILDFGPASGEHGGHIVAQGTYKQILRDPKSLTGQYLSGKKSIPIPDKKRPFELGYLSITDANLHNLKDLSVDIPVGTMTCITGVSGSGKSTLMQQIIHPAMERGLHISPSIELDGKGTVSGIGNFDKMLSIDQNPVGHTVRSDVSTYVEVLKPMRDFFAALPAARTKGLQPKNFSTNHRRGMCTACWGMGYKRVEMFFLPSIKVVCDECKGLRLNPLSLEVKYDGKNMGEWLETTVDDARVAFQNHPRIRKILDTLISVGLGYLKLGQQVVTLSGGEAQRIKLSRELAKRSTGKTLYLLDEPTTGLHQDDIKKLLKVLHGLVDKGNTVIYIEHQIDMIKNADFVIDLGPDAGDKGGEVIFAGTPEDLADHPTSFTAKYL